VLRSIFQIRLLIFIAVLNGILCPAVLADTADTGQSPRLVKFELERNRIIIPTTINHSRPFRLILDTGMRFDGVYLFHESFTNEIDMTDAIEVQVGGAGAGDPSTAMMIESGHVEFGEAAFDGQRVIISRSPHTQGFPTDGVIGWNLFGHYTVKIDYDNQTIELLDTSYTHTDTSWQAIPINLDQDIPFLHGTVEVVSGEVVPMSLYIDLASGDALELLTKSNQKFTMPEKLEEHYLGTGLSGDINGHYGRTVSLRLGNYQLRDIKTAFAPAEVRSKQRGADGILGNDCLRRFNVIFDYTHKTLYIKPNNTFTKAFE
jgi:hypothetical protein